MKKIRWEPGSRVFGVDPPLWASVSLFVQREALGWMTSNEPPKANILSEGIPIFTFCRFCREKLHICTETSVAHSFCQMMDGPASDTLLVACGLCACLTCLHSSWFLQTQRSSFPELEKRKKPHVYHELSLNRMKLWGNRF